MKNAKWDSRIQRVKNSKMGRTLCRLAGDKTGAVMMEYVILAVLICAALFVAIKMLGKDVADQTNIVSKTITNNETDAQTAAGDLKKAGMTRAGEAETHTGIIHGD